MKRKIIVDFDDDAILPDNAMLLIKEVLAEGKISTTLGGVPHYGWVMVGKVGSVELTIYTRRKKSGQTSDSFLIIK